MTECLRQQNGIGHIRRDAHNRCEATFNANGISRNVVLTIFLFAQSIQFTIRVKCSGEFNSQHTHKRSRAQKICMHVERNLSVSTSIHYSNSAFSYMLPKWGHISILLSFSRALKCVFVHRTEQHIRLFRDIFAFESTLSVPRRKANGLKHLFTT